MELRTQILNESGPLHELSKYKQFILWKPVFNGKKWDKRPVSPYTLKVVDPTDPANHADASTVLDIAESDQSFQVGFVFTQSDPFFFLDIDKAYDGKKWSDLANQLINTFSGCAVEVSQSRTGLHIFGQTSPIDHVNKNTSLGIELYTKDRFVALTGFGCYGSAAFNATASLQSVVSSYFINPHLSAEMAQEWTKTHHPDSNPILDDNELISAASRAVSKMAAFSGKASFSDLFNRNVDALAETWPDSEREFDESSADMSLAQMLAFWTGANCERMKSLMLQSKLKRDKWIDRPIYLQNTILKACAAQSDYYTGKKPKNYVESFQTEQPKNETDSENIRVSNQMMFANQQQDYFKNCVYISEDHGILTPSGTILNQGQFNAKYGGYTFYLDLEMRIKTRKAWEAFTESQAIKFPKVYAKYFDPKDPVQHIKEIDGLKSINSYVPVDIPHRPGSVEPFLNHIRKLFPDENDQKIILSYLAAIVQYKGVKFRWCIVLQGTQGNGKNLIMDVIRYCVSNRYYHIAQGQDIDNKFNKFLTNNIFVAINDIKVPRTKAEAVMEVLKPMVSDDYQAIQGKGADQSSSDVVANMGMTSNFKDAVILHPDERRYAVFFTAQQSKADLSRDGMRGDYFPNLNRWLKHDGGYSFIMDFLLKYQIPAHLNPAGACVEAPKTSSYDEALAESRGSTEQEILEYIEQGDEGFRDGWINGASLNALLEEMRVVRRIPQNKRRDILKNLGYVYHPALHKGRSPKPLRPYNKRSILFVHRNSPYYNLKTADAVVEQYHASQLENEEQVKTAFQDNIIQMKPGGN